MLFDQPQFILDVQAIAMCIHPYDMTCLIWYTFESVCRAQSLNMTYEYKKMNVLRSNVIHIDIVYVMQ